MEEKMTLMVKVLVFQGKKKKNVYNIFIFLYEKKEISQIQINHIDTLGYLYKNVDIYRKVLKQADML